ncbi:aminotransferase class III-fold pyridoxal phosphate-dependent enzyme [uncultured Algibacter sp.]|uniref:aminotransferase class III-fold pyridoxal phosphate-dependent enzyme n=1 Tax=uncultured Algibacter sp. TaxID=298659 RepID=UPI002603AC24|nr:aminotransferase class III-fold pyridoxal phosphate-dependent enzyme [uncultured Algibacter sp.]
MILKKTLNSWLHFNIVELKKLNGYDNVNYLVKSDSAKYIFKTYSFTKDILALVTAENYILNQLNHNNQFPKPIAFTDGNFIKVEIIDGKKTICRLLTFLDGDFLAETEHTEKLMQSFGSFLGHLDVQLLKLNNHVFKGRQWEWDLQYLEHNRKYIDCIENHHNRNLVLYFFQQYQQHVQPIAPTLRRSVIHNDANEWNVLVNNNSVSGFIDFGDLAHSFLINELAIALTYVAYDKENPLQWMLPIIKAYHKVLPLKTEELDILYYLIAGRLCTSVCNSANAKKEDPNNTYATVSEKNAWNMLHKWISINPIKAKNAFYKAAAFNIEPVKTANDVLQERNHHFCSNLSVSYDSPIYMKGSAFQYMYDAHGNTFLDAYNNIPHVGHSNPNVVAAGTKQMAQLNTNTRYLYDELQDYAEKLLSKFPNALNKVFFVNSGSAASDLAIRLTHAHTNKKHVMVMEHGYHGNTQLSIDISDYKFSNKKGQGQKNHIIKTPIPDTYRGQYTNNNGTAGQQYAEDAIRAIEQSEKSIAAFISEPVVGCGGQVPLAKDYLKHIYPAIRKQGGVCISDEVQTGFGRLGDVFWGFEAQEVVPDIVILGKPIANGHPMGAVVCTTEIANSFSKGVEFFSSFGGNPVSCAIANAVLQEIDAGKLQQNAKDVGKYYRSQFRALKKKYSCIGDIRGSGLFIGVEIVKENTIEPNTELAHHIKNELRNRFILVSTDGPYDSVIKSKPPLCFTKENAKTVVNAISCVLETYYA